MGLDEYFKKNKINPVEFAVRSGCSQSSIYLYLRGRRPGIAAAMRIQKASGGEVSIEDLQNVPRKTVVAPVCENIQEFPDPMTLEETAQYGHVSRQSIYMAIRRRVLKASKVRRTWYVWKADYDEYRVKKYSRSGRMIDGRLIYDLDEGRYSPSQVAKIVGEMLGRPFSAQRVYYLINAGDLRAQKIGSAWVIEKEDALDLYQKEKQLCELAHSLN